jgi:IS5 family transposase
MECGKGYPLSSMLCMQCLQLLYDRCDPAMENSLYEIEPMRRHAGMRAKVKHTFRFIKQLFGCIKACYCGLDKNNSRLRLLVAVINL